MNAFAENPFFFFVDNMPPISPVNASKNTRRIVELSDAGCDARLSVSTLLRNATRYYSSESAKMRSKEYWKPRCEKKYTNIPLEERFRRQCAQDAIDAEELYFIPKEVESQNYWQDYPTYDMNEKLEHGRKPRIAPERIPQRSQEYNGRYDRIPQRVSDIPRSNSPLQPPFPKSKITANRSQPSHFNYHASEIYDQELFYDRGRSVNQDYSEEFKEAVRNPRSHREHWHRNNEALFEEIAHQNHSSSRYDSRRASSAKSNDRNESAGDKIRSAPNSIRSPTSDRRKRTQSISKTLYQNAESQYDIQAPDPKSLMNNEGTLSCSEKLKRLVDRAVDKDSLSDILGSASKERLPEMAAERPVVKEEARNSFWEFISLEDDDKKSGRTLEKQKPAWPMRTKRQTQNGGLNAKMKRRNGQKSPLPIEKSAMETKDDKGASDDVDQTKLNTEEAVASKEAGNRMNFVEKTVACLKRKIEKSKVEEVSNDVGQSCPLTTEKKIRAEGSTYSRLPIRIGRRLKSKNPVSTRIRSSVEGRVCKEENKDAGMEQNSVRSRTKPKTKPSLLENVDVEGIIEAAEYSVSLGNVQQVAEVNSYEHNGYLDANQKGDEIMIKNSVIDKLMDYADGKLTKEEKLGSTANKRPIGSPKLLNMTGDQRRNETGSPRGRKMVQGSSLPKRIDVSRNCLKDNCFLHLHDEENIVCSGYCTKDCRKLNCLQSRIPTAIKSRL